jgi:hypothetical protein
MSGLAVHEFFGISLQIVLLSIEHLWIDMLLHYTSECLLMRAHVLEAFIDILSSKGFMPNNWEEKLISIQGM